jgi:hypothetical protein
MIEWPKAASTPHESPHFCAAIMRAAPRTGNIRRTRKMGVTAGAVIEKNEDVQRVFALLFHG